MKSIILKGFLPTILKGKFQDIEVVYDFVDDKENLPIGDTSLITIIDVFADKIVLTDSLAPRILKNIENEVASLITKQKSSKDKNLLEDLV